MKSVCSLVCAVLVAGSPAAALAQGPLTGGLPEGEPPVSAYRIGPVYLTPNFAIREIGTDDNVFDDPDNPQQDFMVVLAPDLAAYLRSGLIQVVFTSATDFTYYNKFKSERSIARQLRGRTDFLLSRFRPSIAGAIVDSRSRPNQEIDLRARRSEREISGSVAFEVSPLARAYVGASRVEVEFSEGEEFRGVALDRALNRRNESLQAGVRLALTPFTTLVVEGQSGKDSFEFTPTRNSDTKSGNAILTFGSEAIIVGTVRLGIRDFQTADPTLADFRGVTGAAGLTYTAFWRGRLSGLFERDVQYSFEEDEGYFVSTGGEITYNQRITGPFDLQVRWGRSGLSYADRVTGEGRHDTTNTYAAGVGYNRDSGARIGLTYEQSGRDSLERPDRRYTRRKIFATLTYGF
jgi:hypothetical protein